MTEFLSVFGRCNREVVGYAAGQNGNIRLPSRLGTLCQRPCDGPTRHMCPISFLEDP